MIAVRLRLVWDIPVNSKGGREHRQICANFVPRCTLLA